MTLAGRAYLLRNQVIHIRYLPTPSKHAFVYPTCYLLLSLNDLEDGNLDLAGGYIFGFNSIRNRLSGLRASAYLQNTGTSGKSIREKLVALLNSRGFEGSAFDNAWIMTIPALFGIEIMNPLTVYFCYKSGSSSLWLVVLEVHNTFSERHVYILDTNKQDKEILESFEYQWTFPRQFHISPFNDRSGYYMCQLIPPHFPPPKNNDPFPCSSFPTEPPRPVMKFTLLTSEPAYEKKFMAIQRVTTSTPLSTSSFLKGIISAPFDFMFGLPRTLYEVYILHYHKRLDFYQRPEPRALDLSVEDRLPTVPNAVQADPSITISGGLQWQPKGWIESWCERQIHDYLRRECPRRGVSIKLIPANPAEQTIIFYSGSRGPKQLSSDPNGPEPQANNGFAVTTPPAAHTSDAADFRSEDATQPAPAPPLTLNVYYRSPRLYTIIFSMPSARHALLHGTDAEKIFSVSSPELFFRLFEPDSYSHPGCSVSSVSPSSSSSLLSDYSSEQNFITKSCTRTSTSRTPSAAGRIRTWFVNPAISSMLPIPDRHPLDNDTFQGAFISILILLLLYISGQVEKWTYNACKARFVKGDDPWSSGLDKANFSREPLGSVRRDVDNS